ncbi:MAG: ribose 5-phosphate isomerase B [Flavobacteriales bacterium]|nr:ribose 5-phosphate isomerase B [Flavobacteriales bacterium]
MKIHLGSDHAGFGLKEELKRYLNEAGHQVVDHGTHGSESVDYPEFAHAVARAVAENDGSVGMVVCGSGNGVNITANKQPGIRSALAWLPEIASLAKQHNNANVLALPARFITRPEAQLIVQAFLDANYEGGRHERRVSAIEQC